MKNENSRKRMLIKSHLSLLLNALHKISRFAKNTYVKFGQKGGGRMRRFLFSRPYG
jgi:hypothetical protein